MEVLDLIFALPGRSSAAQTFSSPRYAEATLQESTKRDLTPTDRSFVSRALSRYCWQHQSKLLLSASPQLRLHIQVPALGKNASPVCPANISQVYSDFYVSTKKAGIAVIHCFPPVKDVVAALQPSCICAAHLEETQSDGKRSYSKGFILAHYQCL